VGSDALTLSLLFVSILVPRAMMLERLHVVLRSALAG